MLVDFNKKNYWIEKKYLLDYEFCNLYQIEDLTYDIKLNPVQICITIDIHKIRYYTNK